MTDYDAERQKLLARTEQLAEERMKQRKAAALSKAKPKTYIRHKHESLTINNVEALEEEVGKKPKVTKR